MSNFKKTAGLVAGAAALLVIGSTGGAVAGEMIGGAQIKHNSISTKHIRNGAITSMDIRDGKVKGMDVKEGSLGWRHLNPTTKGVIQNVADRADKSGSLAAEINEQELEVGALGGKFAENATKVGQFNLAPGKYLVSSDGFFDRIDDAQDNSGTHLQVAVRGNDGSEWGADHGTCFTPRVPAGDREVTCSTSKVVTIKKTQKVEVFVFGYNEDQSATGSNNFKANVNVGAVKVG